MTGENPRIALGSTRLRSPVGSDVFLRESVRGVSDAPPAMCHVVIVNHDLSRLFLEPSILVIQQKSFQTSTWFGNVFIWRVALKNIIMFFFYVNVSLEVGTVVKVDIPTHTALVHMLSEKLQVFL